MADGLRMDGLVSNLQKKTILPAISSVFLPYNLDHSFERRTLVMLRLVYSPLVAATVDDAGYVRVQVSLRAERRSCIIGPMAPLSIRATS